jgi:hypothetical protein
VYDESEVMPYSHAAGWVTAVWLIYIYIYICVCVCVFYW